MKTTRDKLLKQIIEKGGLLGECAKTWLNDEEKVNLFLKECSEMCNTPVAKKLWGDKLIRAIIRHCKTRSFKDRRVSGFDLELRNVIKELRGHKGVGQKVMADALEMTQSNYSRIEEGLRPLTIGQLEVIAKTLNVPIPGFLAFANYKKSTQLI